MKKQLLYFITLMVLSGNIFAMDWRNWRSRREETITIQEPERYEPERYEKPETIKARRDANRAIAFNALSNRIRELEEDLENEQNENRRAFIIKTINDYKEELENL